VDQLRRSSRQPASAWIPIGAACFAVFAVYVQIFAVPPLIPLFVRDLGQSHQQAGLLMTVFTAAFAVGSAAAGSVTDRLSPLRTMVAGVAIASVATFAFSLTSDYGVMLALRGLLGIAAALIFPTGISYVAAVRPEWAQLAVGWFFAALYLGISVAFLLGPLLAGRGEWRWLLRGYAAAGIVIAVAGAILAAVTLIEPIAHDTPSRTRIWERVRLLRQPELLLAAGSLFLLMFVIYGAYTWYPPFLAEGRRFSSGQVSLASTLMSLAAIPGAAVAGWIADRTGRRGLVAAIGLASAALLFVAAAATDASYSVLTIIAIVVSFGTAGASVPLFALPAQAVEQTAAAHASGMANVLAFAGAIAATYLGGFMVSATNGYAVGFLVFATVGCIAAVLVVPTYRYLRTRTQVKGIRTYCNANTGESA
jgi:predicted MFS family arabinose efflux permease